MAIKLTIQHFKRKDFSTHAEFRKSIEIHLKKILTGRTVINAETGIVIGFNKSGIEKMVSKIGDVKAFAICNLQPILRHARFVEQQNDKKERVTIISVLLFKTNVEIDGLEFEVWCYVRRQEDGHFLYSLNIDVKNALS